MSPEVTAAWIAAGVGVLTVAATVVAQYFSRRATSRDTQKALAQQSEHLDRTLTEQREQLDKTLAEQRTRTLNERFAAAAGQLGSDKPPEVRLAGVYAMAGLADDWEENRQTCVDVLCGYLRMPYEPDPGEDAPGPQRLGFRASREVRHTVIRVITAHLQGGAAGEWQGLDFDFTGVVFDGGDFTGAGFSGGTVSFDFSVFSRDTVDFTGARSPAVRPDSATPGSPAPRSFSTSPNSPGARSTSPALSSPVARSTSSPLSSPAVGWISVAPATGHPRLHSPGDVQARRPEA